MSWRKTPVDSFKKISHRLQNPFVKTQIKLIGDSITAGQGGTGYSATGTDIGNPATTYKSNVLTATCWANTLYNLINGKYNKEHYVELTHPSVFINKPVEYDANAKLDFRYRNVNNNDSSMTALKFRFYGDHFAVVHAVIAGGGILDVFADGTKIGEIDGYGTATTYSVETPFNALSVGYHDVEIKETGRKNASSSGNTVFLEALKIPKIAVVKNWGISGKNSQDIYNIRTNLIETSDDVLIMQLGTNDRHTLPTPSASKIYQREIIKYAQSSGIDVVLMAANAVSVANDTDVVRNFKMDELIAAIAQLAREFNSPFISNYDAFIQYSVEAGVTIDSLLGDGLHPNDTGYDVMFKNVARGLGLTVLRDGLTY